jgi:hypothetical protein
MSRNRAGRTVSAVLCVLVGLGGAIIGLIVAMPAAGARGLRRAGGPAHESMLGVNDSVLLGGVLVVLVLGVAIMVIGASRPRRHR